MTLPTFTFASFLVLGLAHATQFIGRVNPATKELTWSGSGVSVAFTGSVGSIGINSISGTSSADLIVDGQTTRIANVNGSSIRTPTLRYGNHTLILRKSSEPGFGTFKIGAVSTDGAILSDVNAARKIEIIGDSISVGYGIDGINPCVNTAALENIDETYGSLTAQHFGARVSIVAWSGRGITRNYADGADPLMPELWTRYGANDADDSYTFPPSSTPQAVVINLGTNDFNYLNTRASLNATFFAQATTTFVQEIQGKYPNASIFLMTSPLLSDTYPTVQDAQKTTQTNAFKSVIAQLGSKLHLVDWPTQGSDSGCDYHPNVATHAIGAQQLIPVISAVLGW